MHLMISEQTARRFHALGTVRRLRVLRLIGANKGYCVYQLSEALGYKQPNVSYHLEKLRSWGLVSVENDGLFAYYTLNRQALLEMQGLLTDLLEEAAD